MKYEAISTYRPEFSVGKMCRVLGLKEANYYRWQRYRGKKEIQRLKELQRFELVESVFKESRETYGYRKMQRELGKQGLIMSEYSVRRMMREHGLYPVTNIKYRPYRNGKTDGQYSKDLVSQHFQIAERNKVWAGDITYIKTSLGWVYLATVIDLYNREIIGYSLSKKIDAELAKRALSNALARNPDASGLIFHSDRGCQYSSRSYRDMLEQYGIRSSMSRPGCPYDNSCAESFFATIKKECIYRRKYATLEEVKTDVFEYVELFYNRKRMHTSLGYLSPVEYRLKYDGLKTA